MRFVLVGSMAAVAMLPATPDVGATVPAQAGGEFSTPAERCAIDDPELDELSGLASNGDSWFATNDGGTSLEVYVLNPADCSVREVRAAESDPYDIEDLALASDGSIWLADIGDNRGQRETVAVHVLAPDGGADLYRMAYPDGPHDAEALLLDRSGVPHIVTKEPFGAAGVYRPAEDLDEHNTVPLEQVGSLALSSTDTRGGPVSSSIGSRLVTGASVSQDGTLVAVRTYTEAYVFSAPDGDVVTALQQEPIRIPLPNEPQGEAIAWEPNGTLLSASEGQYPVRAVPGAAESALETAGTVEQEEVPPGGKKSREPAEGAPSLREPQPMPTGRALLLAGGLAVVVMLIGSRLRRR